MANVITIIIKAGITTVTTKDGITKVTKDGITTPTITVIKAGAIAEILHFKLSDSVINVSHFMSL